MSLQPTPQPRTRLTLNELQLDLVINTPAHTIPPTPESQTSHATSRYRLNVTGGRTGSHHANEGRKAGRGRTERGKLVGGDNARRMVDGRENTGGSPVASGDENCDPSNTIRPNLPRRRAPRKSTKEKVDAALAVMKADTLSPLELVAYILDESHDDYKSYRTRFFEDSGKKIFDVLDSIARSTAGRRKLTTWLQTELGMQAVTEVISDEMEVLHHLTLKKGLAVIDEQYIASRNTVDFVNEAPFTFHLLRSAAQSERQKKVNKLKSPELLCKIVLQQLLYQRSNKCFSFVGEFGLFLWATGASRQTIDALHGIGLCSCYQTILDTLDELGNSAMKQAKDISKYPHALGYDNVNISLSDFYEQRGLRSPSKVTSGTLGILYKLNDVQPEVMLLQPLLERMQKASIHGLRYEMDIVPTAKQLESVFYQFKVHVVKIVAKYFSQFSWCTTHPSLQFKKRFSLSITSRRITDFYPLRVSTTEEASTKGNLAFHDEVYLDMLEKTADKLSKYAIPTINDQLTNSRIRSGQLLRAADLNPYHQRLVFQIGMGLFHLCLNLSWALLHVHRGSAEQKGSLQYWFIILHKARHSGEKPDYHTLVATFTQILEGLVINGIQEIIRNEEQLTVTGYARKNPSPEDVLQKATSFLNEFATPLPNVTNNTADNASSKDNRLKRTHSNVSGTIPAPKESSRYEPTAAGDKINQNIRLLTRDMLYLLEAITAIQDGDFGRIEDILSQLAMIFRAAGGNNYCTEILHLLMNLKHVWTPEFANIMREIHIINLSGVQGRSMAMDLNMEHIVGEIKKLLNAKGAESTWYKLGSISAATNLMGKIKKKIAEVLELSHRSRYHSDVDTRKMAWDVAAKSKEETLQIFQEDRPDNETASLTCNLLEEGSRKLKSSTLKTFNTKYRSFVSGRRDNFKSVDNTQSHEADLDEIDTLGNAADELYYSPTAGD